MNENYRTQGELVDVIHLRGRIEAQLQNALTGAPVGPLIIDNNVVVTAGRRWVLSRIITNDSNTITHIAVGTSVTAPATGDSALGSEVGTSGRLAASVTTTGLGSNPPSVQFTVTFATNQGNGTLAEAGLFNSNSAGTMLSHVTFSTINKTTLFLIIYKLLKRSIYAVMHNIKFFLIDSNSEIDNEAELVYCN